MNWELDRLKLSNILNTMRKCHLASSNKGIIQLKSTLEFSKENSVIVEPTFISNLDVPNNLSVRKFPKGYVIGFDLPNKLMFSSVEGLPNVKVIENQVRRFQIEDPDVYKSLSLRFSKDISDLENGKSLTTMSGLYKEALYLIDYAKNHIWIEYSMKSSVSGGPCTTPKDMLPIYNIDGESGDVFLLGQEKRGGTIKFRRSRYNVYSFTEEAIRDTCKRMRWSSLTLTLKGDLDFFRHSSYKRASISD